MFDAAAQVLEEIEPDEKAGNEVLERVVDIYMAAKKWAWPPRLPATL